MANSKSDVVGPLMSIAIRAASPGQGEGKSGVAPPQAQINLSSLLCPIAAFVKMGFL